MSTPPRDSAGPGAGSGTGSAAGVGTGSGAGVGATAPPLALDARFVQSREQISTMQQETCLILSLTGNDYFSLDAVGAYVWSLLVQPCALGELVERILERYAIDRETCQQDLHRLLAALQQEHLITSC